MNRMQTRLIAVVVTLIFAAIVYYFSKPEQAGPGPQPAPPGPQTAPPGSQTGDLEYAHLRWGNPSGAREDGSDKNNFLMKKKYFALSYNNTKGTPNWVSWRLVADDLGHAPRNQVFRQDDELPPGFKKVFSEDYSGWGFDRGHMCPYADRESSEESRLATFIMTNAVPQSPADNRKGWERFESYCRTLVSGQQKELYIVAGPLGEGGVGEKGAMQTLHGKEGPIIVPAKTWKVVVVLDRGRTPDRNAELLAVDMPNDQTVDENWSKYRTTVKAVEQETGYTFFGAVDPALIEPLKEKK